VPRNGLTDESTASHDNSIRQNEAGTMDMIAQETERLKFRPAQITTLFVGESAPVSGDFFYYGNNAMLTHMRTATERSLQPTGDFLEVFKGYGWYLDDVVLVPVNHLDGLQRKDALHNAIDGLATRIRDYKPIAIVSMLLSITRYVEAARTLAKSDAALYEVPFPGMGQQRRFHQAMDKLIPNLPRL
jgi:hypothetical protein